MRNCGWGGRRGRRRNGVEAARGRRRRWRGGREDTDACLDGDGESGRTRTRTGPAAGLGPSGRRSFFFFLFDEGEIGVVRLRGPWRCRIAELGQSFCAAAARIEGRAEIGKLLMGCCADGLSGDKIRIGPMLKGY